MIYNINAFPTSKRNNRCRLRSSISSQFQRDMRPTHVSSNIFFNHFLYTFCMYICYCILIPTQDHWSLDILICLSAPTSVLVYDIDISILTIEDMLILLPSFTDLPQVTDKLHYIMLYRLHLGMKGVRTPTLVVIGTDWTGSCKSNYHTITTTSAP